MNIQEVIDRLQNLTKTKITQSDLARILNKDRQNINRKAKSGTEVKLSDIRKLENHFNVVLINQCQQNDDINGFVDLPVRGNITASMGIGIEILDETQTGLYSVSRKLLRDVGASQNFSEIILAEGDSMYPTIEGGDNILVDHSKKEIYDGKIYCVRIEGKLYAKRLQLIPPRTVVVISDNPKYKAFEIDLSKEIDFDFEVIGEVRYWGRVAK